MAEITEYRSEEEKAAAEAFNNQSSINMVENPIPEEGRDISEPTEADTPSVGGELENSEKPTQDYKVFNPEARKFLLDKADELIDGIKDKQYDSLIFLDAGARLVGYLIRERWKNQYPDISVPDISFIKIGQEMGHRTYDRDEPNAYDYPKDLSVKSLLKYRPRISDIIYDIKANKRFNKLSQSVPDVLQKNNTPDLHGKKVMIIDDFVNSGRTMEYAKELFSQAFPDSSIDTRGFVSNGDRIPHLLGNPYGGLNGLPRYPNFQGSDSLTLETLRPSDCQAEIDELEQQIPLLEEKEKKLYTDLQWEHQKRVYKAHGTIPEKSKFWDAKLRLDKLRASQESITKKIKRYAQALREIHQMAKEQPDIDY